MSNEIMQAPTIDLAPLGEDAMNLAETLAVLNEEMDGLGAVPMPTVKTPAGGGIAFTIGEDDDAEIAKELRGVIVHHHPSNVMYEKSIEESDGDTAPVCSSQDGKQGLVRDTGELRECEGCPFNEFGADGRKRCNNRHNVYILREGDMLPTHISLPATSRANFKKFVAQSIVLKRRRSTDVVAKVTLEKAESKGGQPFSRYKFAVEKELAPQEKAKMREYGEGFKAYIQERNAEWMRRDAAGAEAVKADSDVIDVDYRDMNIPF